MSTIAALKTGQNASEQFNRRANDSRVCQLAALNRPK